MRMMPSPPMPAVLFGKIDAQRFRRVDLLLEAVEVDVVVARAVHLRKRQAHLLRAHVVDVHKLRAVLGNSG